MKRATTMLLTVTAAVLLGGCVAVSPVFAGEPGGGLSSAEQSNYLAELKRLYLTQDERQALLAQAVVARKGPEVEAGVAGLGRDGVEHEAVDALAAVALRRAAAHGGGDGTVAPDQHVVTRAAEDQVVALPACELSRKAGGASFLDMQIAKDAADVMDDLIAMDRHGIANRAALWSTTQMVKLRRLI